MDSDDEGEGEEQEDEDARASNYYAIPSVAQDRIKQVILQHRCRAWCMTQEGNFCVWPYFIFCSLKIPTRLRLVFYFTTVTTSHQWSIRVRGCVWFVSCLYRPTRR